MDLAPLLLLAAAVVVITSSDSTAPAAIVTTTTGGEEEGTRSSSTGASTSARAIAEDPGCPPDRDQCDTRDDCFWTGTSCSNVDVCATDFEPIDGLCVRMCASKDSCAGDGCTWTGTKCDRTANCEPGFLFDEVTQKCLKDCSPLSQEECSGDRCFFSGVSCIRDGSCSAPMFVTEANQCLLNCSEFTSKDMCYGDGCLWTGSECERDFDTCHQGWVRTDQQMHCSKNCGLGKNENDICVCPGLLEDRGLGIGCECPPGSEWNLELGECTCPEANHFYNTSTRRCECKETFYAATCQCPAERALDQEGLCRVCLAPHKSWNQEAGTCLCDTSFDTLFDGTCACPAGTQLNAETGACTDCIFADTEYNGTTCACIVPEKELTPEGCQCPPHLQESSDGTCGECADANAVLEDLQCVCKPGMSLVDGMCACPPYRKLDENGGCEACALQGKYFDQDFKMCRCNADRTNNHPIHSTDREVFEAAECRCKPGSIVAEDGACTSECQPGYIHTNSGCSPTACRVYQNVDMNCTNTILPKIGWEVARGRGRNNAFHTIHLRATTAPKTVFELGAILTFEPAIGFIRFECLDVSFKIFVNGEEVSVVQGEYGLVRTDNNRIRVNLDKVPSGKYRRHIIIETTWPQRFRLTDRVLIDLPATSIGEMQFNFSHWRRECEPGGTINGCSSPYQTFSPQNKCPCWDQGSGAPANRHPQSMVMCWPGSVPFNRFTMQCK